MSIHTNGKRLSGLEVFNKIEGKQASRLFVKGSPALMERLNARIQAAPFNLELKHEPRETRGSIIRLSILEGRPLMDVAHIIMSDEFDSLEITTDEAST